MSYPNPELSHPEIRNLINDSSVAGIGEEELVCLYPEKVKGAYTGRWHEQHILELDGHRHSLLVTDSVSPSETDLYFYPGFTQTSDEPGGLGFKFHTEMARRRPNTRIISVASTGIGRFGDRITDPNQATVDAMGEQRARIAEAVSSDRRIQLVGLSMGSVVKNRLLKVVIEEDKDLEIAACVNYVVALVVPERVTRDMLVRFPIYMLPDALREFFDKRNLLDPRKLVATVKTAGRLGLCAADLTALHAMGMSLKQGTKLELIKNETENFKTAVISGSSCPLTQPKMWATEEEVNPQNVNVRIVSGRGHGMAVDSVGAAASIDHKLSEIDPAA